MQTGWLGHFSQDVPAGDVDARLDVGVAFQRRCHLSIERAQLRRIRAEQMRRQFSDAGADAVGISRQVKGTQRADFAVARNPAVGIDADYRAIEDFDRLPARPFIAAFVQRQVHLISGDALDFHG